MMTLLSLQQQLQHYILGRSNDIESHLQVANQGDAEDRVMIYRNNYRQCLIKSIKMDYPSLLRMMGDEAMTAMIKCYLECYPSTYFSLNFAGEKLSEFLLRQPQCHPCFSELARFENTLTQILLVKDEPALTIDALSQLSEEGWMRLRFQCQYSIRIFIAQFSTLVLWRQLQLLNGESEMRDTQSHSRVERMASSELMQHYQQPLPQPEHYLIWRNLEYQPVVIALDEKQLKLIRLIQQGLKFSQICGLLSVHYGDDLEWVTVLLQQWIAEGLFLAA